ncbi:hypothetical protein LIER_12154 [Lithospermum erythrorhizon]|uniref:Uncharacterized protein n=1 Tax=Lithospermum erythrorhizon TaxID=34254 RepID=A0AAV3PSD8_LITER
MVPKELITQRMQIGAKGKSWEVALRILEKDGILGLYVVYNVTLLRNFLAAISYFAFETGRLTILNEYLRRKGATNCEAQYGRFFQSIRWRLKLMCLTINVRGKSGGWGLKVCGGAGMV